METTYLPNKETGNQIATVLLNKPWINIKDKPSFAYFHPWLIYIIINYYRNLKTSLEADFKSGWLEFFCVGCRKLNGTDMNDFLIFLIEMFCMETGSISWGSFINDIPQIWAFYEPPPQLSYLHNISPFLTTPLSYNHFCTHDPQTNTIVFLVNSSI